MNASYPRLHASSFQASHFLILFELIFKGYSSVDWFYFIGDKIIKKICLLLFWFLGGKDIFDTANKYIYFCMDGSVAGYADSIEDAFKMLFASYFVFNLMYAANAQITLEFIQR